MSLTKDVKFGPDWILHVDVSVNKPFPVASRWRYDYNAILAFRCVQARTLIKPVKFGADRTFYGLVTTTSIPMARHQILSRHQGHAF